MTDAQTFSALGQSASFERTDATLSVSGSLTFSTVPEVGGQLARLVGDAERINLAAMERIDSAGVALLLEAMLSARQAGRSLRLEGVPSRMRALIDVYGIAEFMQESPVPA
jgi:Predicted NTP binding protein (contains STAS domain)